MLTVHGAIAQGMNFSPEMMKMAADMMKNMSPEDFQRMSAMAGAAGGMPGASPGALLPLNDARPKVCHDTAVCDCVFVKTSIEKHRLLRSVTHEAITLRWFLNPRQC